MPEGAETPKPPESTTQRENPVKSTLKNVGRNLRHLWLNRTGYAKINSEEFGELRNRYAKVRPFVKEAMSQQRKEDFPAFKKSKQRQTFQQGAFKTAENMYPLVMQDSMTGLLNRRFFEANADRILAEARRGGRKTAIFILDLDGMKYINDNYGHEKGDEMIKGAANLIKQAVRESDDAIRLGGDEFVVIAHDIHDIENESGALLTGEKIRAAIFENLAKVIGLDSEQGKLGTTVGFVLDHDKLTASQLLHQADTALYNGKRPNDGSQAKNRVVQYQEGMTKPEKVDQRKINR